MASAEDKIPAKSVVNLDGEGEYVRGSDESVVNFQPGTVGGSSELAQQCAIEVARGTNQPVVRANGDRLPFADGSVDKVVTNNVPVGSGHGYFGPDFHPAEIQRILAPCGEWVGNSRPGG